MKRKRLKGQIMRVIVLLFYLPYIIMIVPMVLISGSIAIIAWIRNGGSFVNKFDNILKRYYCIGEYFRNKSNE